MELIVSFTVPFVPPSVNCLYGVTSRGGRIRTFLKSDAARFKEKAKLFMIPKKVLPATKIHLELIIKTNWYYKNGSVKKIDIQNMEKILLDAISEKYGFDDSMIWSKTCEKQDGEDSILVSLYEK
jgi:Holliday junction resolvase RusA-like endonuclease